MLFIAQVFHIDFTLHQQIGMLLILMITSKGIAGVPRASLIVIAGTLTYFGLPERGLVLIIAVSLARHGAQRHQRRRQRRGVDIGREWENELRPARRSNL